MLTYTSIESVIGGFVKFSIVANVGDTMALTLTTKIDIKDETGSKPIMMRAKTKWDDDIELTEYWKEEGKMNTLQWFFMVIMLIVTRILKFFYVTVYYYFTPIMVLGMLELSYHNRPRLTAPAPVVSAP